MRAPTPWLLLAALVLLPLGYLAYYRVPSPQPPPDAGAPSPKRPKASWRSQVKALERQWVSLRDQIYNVETTYIMGAVLRGKGNAVDVGSYKGDILAQMARFSPHGSHHGFEPLPHLARHLKRRFAGQQKIAIHPVALGHTNGHADFHHVVTNPGYSGFKKRAYTKQEKVRKIRVEVRTLDAVLPTQTIDFLKIDVEGAEYQVLLGAQKLLRRCKPVVVFEHGKGSSDRYGSNPTKIYRLLHDQIGLKIHTLIGWIRKTKPLTLTAFREQFDRGLNWYFVAYDPKKARP